MQVMHSPWRMKYIMENQQEDGCLFCRVWNDRKDDDNFVVLRREHCFIMLNAYPYNNGHIMIVPNRHVASLTELNQAEIHELMELTQLAEKALRQCYSPQGINLGMNIGKAAGAGIADHLHMHVLPRWTGDSNFMCTVAQARVIPEDMTITLSRLRGAFEKVLDY